MSLRVLLRLESEGPEGLGVLAVEDSCELAADPEALEAYKHKQPTVNNSAPYQVQISLACLSNDNVFLSEVHVYWETNFTSINQLFLFLCWFH